MNPADDIHRSAWDRIPWVLGGSADEATQSEVLAHVASCPRCREEYALQQGMRDALQATPVPPARTEAGLQQLWQQVDREPVPQHERSATSAPWTRWMAAAVVMQAVALTLLVAERSATSAPPIVTLSSPSAASAAQLRIAPAPELSLRQWQSLLA